MFASIVVDHQVMQKEESLLYRVPKELTSSIVVGQVVLVPFGRIQKRGIVINLKNENIKTKYSIRNIKHITFSEPVINLNQIKLAQNISKYYFVPLYKAIKLFIPQNIWFSDHKVKTINIYTLSNEKIVFSSRAKKKQNFYLDIKNLNKKKFKIEELKKLESFSQYILTVFVKDKILIRLRQEERRDPLKDYIVDKKDLPKLTTRQKEISEKILSSKKKHHLIRGITGSGKTEIYISIVNAMLNKRKSVIILIPEINLTPQNINRFNQYFSGEIAVWHSHLSDGEKFDEWRRIKKGDAKIIIGSRSALFTPVQNLGAIIIDEEHDQSYKQDSSPRYHAKKVAILYSQIQKDLLLVMGDATPSMESYYFAKQDVFCLHEIDQRYFKASLPTVKIVDLSQEKRHFKSAIGYQLYLAISESLEAKQQVVLLLNKRGIFQSMQCFDCGHVLTCDRCDIPYTVHKDMTGLQHNRLMCHYCGKQAQIEKHCQKCGGVMMIGQGYGTQSIEQELIEKFPYAKILRADRDSMSKKGSRKTIYDKFLNHEADILIGTQMIAKGLDIPNVNLVGVILADIGLHMPEFRAQERIFQLLTQVAGRAGRRENQGKVIIQTYSVENPAITFAKNHDYLGFYENELITRKMFNYPPFSNLLKLTYVDYSLEKVQREAERLSNILKQKFPKAEILGPTPALMMKIYNKYHYQILVKSKKRDLFEGIMKIVPTIWRVDIDPR